MKLVTDSRRTQNMQVRRARILAEARSLLAQRGPDGVNLRELASLADVTVPTIYNLIGNKEDLLVALFSEVLGEIESRIQTEHIEEPLALAEAVVAQSYAIFVRDENYYRSAFLAVEYLNQRNQDLDTVSRLYSWGEHLLTAGFVACKAAGLLRGRIAPDLLGEVFQRTYRVNLQAWAFGHISLEELRDTSLVDVHIVLASDAVETFHASLIKKIAKHRRARASISTPTGEPS